MLTVDAYVWEMYSAFFYRTENGRLQVSCAVAVLGEPIKGRHRVSRCKHFAPRPGRQPVGNTEIQNSAVICYKGNEEAFFFFFFP
jgi:hypothetical protein